MTRTLTTSRISGGTFLIAAACALALLFPPTPVIAAGRPDLAVDSAGGPAAATIGARATFKSRIVNAGTGAAGPSKVTFFLSMDKRLGRSDTKLEGTADVPPLSHGGAAAVRARLRVPSDVLGPQYLIACVDRADQIAEINEQDNCSSSDRTTWFRPRPTSYTVATPNPLDVDPVVAEGAAVTEKIVAAEGGQLSLTDGGDRFTLTIPAQALVSDVAITMTPVRSVGGLPLSGGLLGGVDLAPDGLSFLRPVTLEISPDRRVPTTEQMGYAYAGEGGDFHLYPLQPGDNIVLKLTHFTGVGVGSGTQQDRAAQSKRLPLMSEAQWEQKLEQFSDRIRDLKNSGQVDDANDQLAHGAELLAGYLRQVAMPALRQALLGDTTRTGPPTIRKFISVVRQISLLGAEDAYDAIISEGWELVHQLIKKMFEDAFHRCVEERDPQMSILMLSVARQGQLLGMPESDFPYGERLAKCLRFELVFDFAVDADGYTDTFADGRTVYTDHRFHLRAPRVPIYLREDDLTDGQINGAGTLEYLEYSGSSDTVYTWVDTEPDPDVTRTCHGTASASGTENGTFEVTDIDFDLNYYANDPAIQRPFRMVMVINPGGAGADSAAVDRTTYTNNDPDHCFLPVGTVSNWLWALYFYGMHHDEAENDEGTAYTIRNWQRGGAQGAYATKTYERSLPISGTTLHETTTLVLNHVPQR